MSIFLTFLIRITAYEKSWVVICHCFYENELSPSLQVDILM